MPPTLSICIPTYNRAELLESALLSVVPQVRELGAKVELVVSDNCSTDNTKELVARFSSACPLRYHRNDHNVGVIRNVLNIVESLATGEFCWIIGDDDMLRPGALQQLLDAIGAHPDLDYFYVNYSIDEFRNREGRIVTPDEFPNWTLTGNENQNQRVVERWQDLVAEDFGVITPIYCSVFRRTVWLKGAATLNLPAELQSQFSFSSVEESFPHALIFARTMMGRRAWVSGYPWVIVCSRESWLDWLPVIVLLRFHELLDEYVRLGVNARLLRRHRRRMLSYSGDLLMRVFRGERMPQLQSFSVGKFILKHCRRRELWRALADALTASSLRSIAAYSIPLAAFALIPKLVNYGRILLRKMSRRLRPRLHPQVPGTR